MEFAAFDRAALMLGDKLHHVFAAIFAHVFKLRRRPDETTHSVPDIAPTSCGVQFTIVDWLRRRPRQQGFTTAVRAPCRCRVYMLTDARIDARA